MRSRLSVFALSFSALAAGCWREPSRATAPVAGVAADGGRLVAEAPKPSEIDHAGGADETVWVSPCAEGSAEQQSAGIALRDFDQKIGALSPSADPKPLEAEFEKLIEHPCLALASVDPRDDLRFASAFSLQSWWRAGGSDWLISYLRAEEHRMITIPPTPRVALTVETAKKDHPLGPLLCPADASIACGTDAAGWARRAREKLSLVASLRSRSSTTPETCGDMALKEASSARYASFRSCLEHVGHRERALPLGRFKAPTDGWLLLVDAFPAPTECHAVRAYDLATGSTYSIDDCARRNGALTTGRVSISAIREAAWMLMLADTTQEDVRFVVSHIVPDGVPITRPRTAGVIHRGLHGAWGPQDRHAWAWMRERNGVLRGQVSGAVIGRGLPNDAMVHAFDLLDIADDTLETGCAPAAAPPRIAWGAPGPSMKEGTRTILDDVDSAPLRDALVKPRAPSRPCAAKP